MMTTTEITPQVGAIDLHPVRPLGRARFFDLVNAVLYYGILGLGVMIPALFALYALLFG